MPKRSWSGLESVVVRPMTDADRESLRQRARDVTTKAALWFLIIPPLALADWWVFTADDTSEVAVGVLLLLTAASPIVLLMAASHAYDLRRPLVAGLRRGEVEVFRGEIRPLLSADPTLVKLGKGGFFHQELDVAHEVELLPATLLVHQVDGRFVDIPLKADVLETATPRELPPTMGDPGGARVLVLTDEERAELRKRAARLWKTPGILIFLVCYLGIGAFMWRVGGSEWLETFGIRFAILSVLALAALGRFLGRVRTARRLERDADQGEVVVVFADQPNPDGSISRLMVLPHAKMVWSLDGQPAEWRSEKL